VMRKSVQLKETSVDANSDSDCNKTGTIAE
jgi:hypothetical protein